MILKLEFVWKLGFAVLILVKDLRLNKLDISEFKTIASNDNLTLNWVSYFISRPKHLLFFQTIH